MVATFPVPAPEFERVSEANRTVVDVAQSLIAIAGKSGDPHLVEELKIQISRLLDSSDAISGAIRSTAYVRRN
jgi:hypothetical protein